jgi:hypothetical protein
MTNIYKSLEFKLTMGEDNNIRYLDLSIRTGNHSLQMGIYRKTTQTVTTTNFKSNHPLQHKIAAYRFHVNRMLFTPTTDQARQQGWDTNRTTAKSNGFPLCVTHILKNKIIKTQKQTIHSQTHNRKHGSHLCITAHSYLRSLIYFNAPT